jgi:hypothetical protein
VRRTPGPCCCRSAARACRPFKRLRLEGGGTCPAHPRPYPHCVHRMLVPVVVLPLLLLLLLLLVVVEELGGGMGGHRIQGSRSWLPRLGALPRGRLRCCATRQSLVAFLAVCAFPCDAVCPRPPYPRCVACAVLQLAIMGFPGLSATSSVPSPTLPQEVAFARTWTNAAPHSPPPASRRLCVWLCVWLFVAFLMVVVVGGGGRRACLPTSGTPLRFVRQMAWCVLLCGGGGVGAGRRRSS